ncbi:MAG: phospho-sugar mutase [Firmicutes bacterium]|nr:phospho-sugar mutase [Bacillota bacterium]
MEKKQLRENAITEYRRWLDEAEGDSELKEELLNLAEDEDELIDSFSQHLKFGTSGLRGILGVGTNRLNTYVVRRTTQGFANYLKKNLEDPAVVIAYDTRKNSKLFAEETAKVLRGNDVKVYLFPKLATVSLLSYSIDALGCDMGIMITASHNPKIYNGYKVYNKDGYQIIGSVADAILKEIGEIDFFDQIPASVEGILDVPDTVGQAFIEDILGFLPPMDKETLTELKAVYTPLNGTGNYYVREVFKGLGYEDVIIVADQEYPDEEFTTCPAPNPEKITAFAEGFKILNRMKADIIIATDPDCDRVGACVKHGGMNALITGNQLAALILDYLCQVKEPKEGQKVIKSIVTTPMVERIAKAHGLEVVNTLTGFKYIGEMITELRSKDEGWKYYFGCEESHGYLMSDFIRDKDGVSSAALLLCAAAYQKARGKDLVLRLRELYEEYGQCKDKTKNYEFHGPFAQIHMDMAMTHFREQNLAQLGGKKIVKAIDYLDVASTGLPKSNVLKYELEDGTEVIIRPSGTEPKMKVYIFESGNDHRLEDELKAMIERFNEC